MYAYRILRKEDMKKLPVFLGDAERVITFLKTAQMRDYTIEAYPFNEELPPSDQYIGPSSTQIEREYWADDLRKTLTWIHAIEDTESVIKKRG